MKVSFKGRVTQNTKSDFIHVDYSIPNCMSRGNIYSNFVVRGRWAFKDFKNVNLKAVACRSSNASHIYIFLEN